MPTIDQFYRDGITYSTRITVLDCLARPLELMLFARLILAKGTRIHTIDILCQERG
jgi:hypothetical protein